MTEFTLKDYHKDFITYCKAELDNYITQFDDNNKQILILKNKLDLRYDLLVKYKVSNIIKDNINNITPIKLIITNNIEQQFILDYNHFNKLINDNCILANTIKLYNVYFKLPYCYYKILIQNLNLEISRLLLKGYSFPFPLIGSVYIGRVPYNSSIPDWGRSFKFRQELRDNGIEIKSLENKDGANWFVDNGLNREDFIILRWRKYTSKLHNYKPYRLEPAHYKNIYDKIINNETIPLKSLFNMKNTGIFDKIIHIYKYHYEYGKRTFPFVKSNKDKEND